MRQPDRVDEGAGWQKVWSTVIGSYEDESRRRVTRKGDEVIGVE